MSRDYAAELRAVIESEYVDGDTIPGVAARIVEKLEATDAALLNGWLRSHATTLIGDEIRRIDRSERTRARTAAPRRAFAEAASSGIAEQVAGFLGVRFEADPEGARLSFGAFRKANLLYLAGTYEVTSRRALTEAAFLRAVAKKVGTRTVAEVFDEKKITTLRASILGEAA